MQAVFSNYPSLRVAHYEWKRLLRLDAIILSGVFLIIISGITFGMTLTPGADSMEGKINLMGLSQTIPNLSRMFIVFFMILGIGAEYSQSTYRKRLINGYARIDLYSAGIWMIGIGILLFMAILSLAFAAMFVIKGANAFALLKPGFLFLLLQNLLHYGAFALMLVTVIQRTGIAILLYFVTGLVEGALTIFFMFKLQNPSLTLYLPLNGLETLPMLSASNEWWKLLVSPAYVLLFLSITWLKIRKTEF